MKLRHVSVEDRIGNFKCHGPEIDGGMGFWKAKKRFTVKLMNQKNFNPWIAVWVAALGYFVDVFDILLFSVVRTTSLKDLGIEGEALLTEGIFLINAQMIGMLVGGVLFGVLGDKKGRLSVLFSSILLYSVANIANAFVHNVPTYAVLRFLAGLGLAGELGVGIALVSEVLPKEKRGLGTTLVATVGVAGALVASIVTRYMSWRAAYVVAGLMGLALLFLRVSVKESGMFNRTAEKTDVKRGDLMMILGSGPRFLRFLYALLPGLPIYFVLGILVTFAPELGKNIGLGETLTAGDAVFYAYIGYILGDLGSGLLSQKLQSRRKALFIFITLTFLLSAFILKSSNLSLSQVHGIYCALGFFSGYWAVFITTAAEGFGTNLRATVATSVPNFVRGAVVLMTLSLNALKGNLGFLGAAFWVLVPLTLMAFGAVFKMRETFFDEMDYLETEEARF